MKIAVDATRRHNRRGCGRHAPGAIPFHLLYFGPTGMARFGSRPPAPVKVKAAAR